MDYDVNKAVNLNTSKGRIKMIVTDLTRSILRDIDCSAFYNKSLVCKNLRHLLGNCI